MFCQNCGKENDDDSVFCQHCGEKLKQDSVDSKNILIIFLVGILIIGSVIGIMFVMNNNDNDSSNVNEVSTENSEVVQEKPSNYQPTWHSIGSYGGVHDYSVPVNIKGDGMKVEFQAFPIKNYADNDMTVRVYKDGNYLGSANVAWNGQSDVETRYNSIEFSGPGNYQVYVSAYELVSWNMEIYELS